MKTDYKHVNPTDAAEVYENALIDIVNATDARGLPILLLPYPAGKLPGPRDFRRAIAHLCGNLEADTEFFASLTLPHDRRQPEIKFAENLALLAAGWKACLEYDDAKEKVR